MNIEKIDTKLAKHKIGLKKRYVFWDYKCREPQEIISHNVMLANKYFKQLDTQEFSHLRLHSMEFILYYLSTSLKLEYERKYHAIQNIFSRKQHQYNNFIHL
jgi:hypothetical protein